MNIDESLNHPSLVDLASESSMSEDSDILELEGLHFYSNPPQPVTGNSAETTTTNTNSSPSKNSGNSKTTPSPSTIQYIDILDSDDSDL